MALGLPPEKEKVFEEMLSWSENAFLICLGFSKNPQDAEDLTQEAYLKAYQKIDSLQSAASAREWLFRIVRNTCLDQRRKRSLFHLFSLQSVGDSPEYETPESQVLRGEQIRLLKRTVRNLPKKLKEIFVLREYGHLSYQEIAAVLGIPQGTVMSRLNRARQAVARGIKEVDHERRC